MATNNSILILLNSYQNLLFVNLQFYKKTCKNHAGAVNNINLLSVFLVNNQVTDRNDHTFCNQHNQYLFLITIT